MSSPIQTDEPQDDDAGQFRSSSGSVTTTQKKEGGERRKTQTRGQRQVSKEATLWGSGFLKLID